MSKSSSPEGYLTLTKPHRTEKIIQKSRFIATSSHTEGVEEANSFIQSIRDEFPGATHNCYAYIADKGESLVRSSDDGEPSGTAGGPILDAIKNNSLVYCAVVVTRYFGGIKLGAGGLVRAYSGSCAENLRTADKKLFVPWTHIVFSADYCLFKTCSNYLSRANCVQNGVNYLDSVFFDVYVRKEDEGTFMQGLFDSLGGKVKIEKRRENEYRPQKDDN